MLLLPLHAEVIPSPPTIYALPQGEVGRTPMLWIGASAGGGWSSAAANTAVARAMSTLGIPYAFAGGTFWGPSRGVPVDFDSRNDGNVIGYDCSGLTLFAFSSDNWRRPEPEVGALMGRVRPRTEAMQKNSLEALKEVQAILTPAQWAKVPDRIKTPRSPFGGPGGQNGQGAQRRPPPDGRKCAKASLPGRMALVLKNGSNACSRTSSDIPKPVSSTARTATRRAAPSAVSPGVSAFVAIVIVPPPGIASRALTARLMIACSN
jgi:hypothetical protein